MEVAPGSSSAIAGSALLGAFSTPEIDFGFTAAHNYIISASIINEARVGYNGNHLATNFNANPSQLVSEIDLTGLPSLPPGNAVPNFNIAGFQPTGGTSSSRTRNGTFQILDNVTWTKGEHTIKVGADYRYLTGHSENVYANYRLGQYNSTERLPASAARRMRTLGIHLLPFCWAFPTKRIWTR